MPPGARRKQKEKEQKKDKEQKKEGKEVRPLSTETPAQRSQRFKEEVLTKAKAGKALLQEKKQPVTFFSSKSRAQLVELAKCLLHLRLYTTVLRGLSESDQIDPALRRLYAHEFREHVQLVTAKDDRFIATCIMLLSYAGHSEKNIGFAMNLLQQEVHNEWKQSGMIHTHETNSVKNGGKPPAHVVRVAAVQPPTEAEVNS